MRGNRPRNWRIVPENTLAKLVVLVSLSSLEGGCDRRPGASTAPDVPGTMPPVSAAATGTGAVPGSSIASSAAPEKTSASAPSSAPSTAQSAASPTAPLPRVRITNIGMHIGGGPNDDLTKAPIKSGVQPHFDTFRRCFALVDESTRWGDFGVDLHIPRGGGRPQVRLPRTALRGPGFVECMVQAFEAMEFQPLPRGETVVSYSLRFAPE